MTGALTLSGDPTTALHAATKQYADGLDAATRAVLNSGDATLRSEYQAADAGKVAKTGDTMSGTLEIGNADPYFRLHRHGVVFWDLKAMADGACGIYNNSNAWGWYSVSGTLHVPGNVVAYWSDRRLKEAIKPLDGYEERIMGLRPVSFEWNEKGCELTGKKAGEREIGFIAQETKAVYEQYVAENKTAEAADGEDPYLTVKKDEMIADLVAMVQSLNRRLTKLEGMI
jgi:hypothetical protein